MPNFTPNRGVRDGISGGACLIPIAQTITKTAKIIIPIAKYLFKFSFAKSFIFDHLSPVYTKEAQLVLCRKNLSKIFLKTPSLSNFFIHPISLIINLKEGLNIQEQNESL